MHLIPWKCPCSSETPLNKYLQTITFKFEYFRKYETEFEKNEVITQGEKTGARNLELQSL